jgi:hypothetical protein
LTRRSPTNPPSPTTPPPKHVFFIDRDLGNVIIPRALEGAGYVVERFHPRFNANTLDVEWFPFVGAQGWLALSRNRRQRYVPDEREVAMRSRLALFHIIRGGSHTALAPILARLAPKILAFRDRKEPPFIARVYRSGKIVLDLTLEQWQKMPKGRRA